MKEKITISYTIGAQSTKSKIILRKSDTFSKFAELLGALVGKRDIWVISVLSYTERTPEQYREDWLSAITTGATELGLAAWTAQQEA